VSDVTIDSSAGGDTGVSIPKLAGAPNFRDLGGYTGARGRRVRRGRLFRSDHLGALSDSDRELLSRLGVRTILDFRSLGERDAYPCSVTQISNVSLAIQTDTAQRLQELVKGGKQLTGEKGREVMCDVYRTYIRTHANSFRTFFGKLLEHDGPHVYHCTAGKDRTGTASAMLLTALGVEWDVIVRDYLLTNVHWKLGEHQAVGMPPDVRDALGRADETYLRAAFEVIESEYGGWDAYARNELGIGEPELARLRAWYLED
jgi:protein-tyrosine phosphatase